MNRILKESMTALPKFIKGLNLISKDFNKFAKNPLYIDKIVDSLGAIICINEGNLYNDLDEQTLTSLKESIKIFSKSILYYFEQIQKDINSALENKHKNDFDNMSREELLRYVKGLKL